MIGNTTPLNEFVTLQRGHDLPQSERIAGKIPVIASTGIAGYHNEAKAKAPGVVIGRSGSIGGGQYVTVNFWPLNTTLWVKDFKGHNERFVYYLFKNIDFTTFNVGTGVPTLNRNHLSSILIENIGRSAENKISKILGDLDDKIALNAQINQTLEAMAQALFKSWFVNFDPVKAKMEARANGGDDNAVRRAAMTVISGKSEEELQLFERKNPKAFAKLAETADLFPERLVESELGEIPEGWEVGEIGDQVTVKGGSTPSTKNSIYWDGGTNCWTTPKDLSTVTEKVLVNTVRKITDLGVQQISSGILPENTVLLSSRAPVGYLAVAKVPICINQGYIAMVCDKKLSYTFVIQWANVTMDEIKARASGTTFQEISKGNFRPIKVIVPSKHVLSSYDGITTKYYDQITQNVHETANLQITSDLLLPRLLSGEIDLSSFDGQED
ncbi:MAG: restriction endonuclease subunit S [Chitinispirillaceae bacterium]|nr:restriction endonuclease subunit S [Chitinispirillaceae bacterium]